MPQQYSSEQIKDFRAKDLRVHKVAICKSYIEKHGRLPSVEELGEAIQRIYDLSEHDKRIIENVEDTPF